MAGKSKIKNFAIGMGYTSSQVDYLLLLLSMNPVFLTLGTPDTTDYNTHDGSNRTSIWNDLTTTPANATQGTLADQPLYDAANKWLDFDGTTDFLSSGNVAKLRFSTEFTIFVGFRPDSIVAVGNKSLVSKYNTTGNQRGYRCLVNLSKARITVSQDGTGLNQKTVEGSTVLDTSRTDLFVFDYKAGNYNIYNQKTAETLTITSSVGTTNSIFNSTAPVKIGAANGTNEFFDGKILCVCAFSTQLSTTDRELVVDYLKSLTGI